MPDASTLEEHRDRILGSLTPVATTRVGLADAVDRVLAEPVAAVLDLPRFDHAAMDGFAVRAADVASASGEQPVSLPVGGVVAAGDGPAAHEPGTATRIMTGAQVPAGADAVVPFEWTDGGSPVVVRRPAQPGAHIRRAAEEVAAGDTVLGAGALLGPAQVALLAAAGVGAVTVLERPRVAIVSTGSELADGVPREGAVPDSNAVGLFAAVTALGGMPHRHGPIADSVADLRSELVGAAAHADLVITTGGVSAGDHDVVKAALRDEPGFWFGHVAIKPGRPQGCGTLEVAGRRVPVVCLPGTPVAAYSSFLVFAAPALRALAGRPAVRRRTALLAAEVTATDRTVLLPASYDDEGRVAPLAGHVGHSQRMLAAADALLVVPPVVRVIPAGEPVEVVALRPEEER